jgi:hypothetical protein
VIFLLFLVEMICLLFLLLIQEQIYLRCLDLENLRKATSLYLPSPNNILRNSVVFTQTLSI